MSNASVVIFISTKRRNVGKVTFEIRLIRCLFCKIVPDSRFLICIFEKPTELVSDFNLKKI